MVADSAKTAPNARQRKRDASKVVGLANRQDGNPDRQLSRAEETFLDSVLLGWPYHRAYTTATGATCKKNTAETQAWRWLHRPAVAKALAQRRASLDERLAMTRTEKRVILGNIAREPSVPALARIGAIQVDNRMTGHDEPQRVIVSGQIVFSVDPMADARKSGPAQVVNVTPAPIQGGSVPALPADALPGEPGGPM